MKKIYTKRGTVLVDDADYAWASKYHWYINDSGYVYRSEVFNGKTRNKRMHRELLNAPRNLDVDHINGNRADNRRENLRLCTRSQNLKNKTVLRRDNRSGVTGVYYHRERHKWTVQIQLHGKPKHIGLFSCKKAAIKARREAELKYYKEFAPK